MKAVLGTGEKNVMSDYRGIIYSKQGKTAEAEQTYQQALIGYENSCGAKHILTLYTVNNLGRLYLHQGKIAEAEQILLRALTGY
jgi:tetratricopeptide (TPR) repeat protein